MAELSEHLWRLEMPASAASSMCFVGAVNRPGTEAPWNIGEFHGTSFWADPRGQIIAEGARSEDDVVIADLDMDLIQEERRRWQFFRDRRPETYGDIAKP